MGSVLRLTDIFHPDEAAGKRGVQDAGGGRGEGFAGPRGGRRGLAATRGPAAERGAGLHGVEFVGGGHPLHGSVIQ